MAAVAIGDLVDDGVELIKQRAKEREKALNKFKDECLARHQLKTKNRRGIELWLKKQGDSEQYWRDTLNRVIKENNATR